MVLFCLLLSIAFSRFGRAIAEMIPMIATTMSSSIKVKPPRFFSQVLRMLSIGAFPLPASEGQGRCQTGRFAPREGNCRHNIMMDERRARVGGELCVPKNGGRFARLPFRVRSFGHAMADASHLHRGSLPLKLRALRAPARSRSTFVPGADVAQW